MLFGLLVVDLSIVWLYIYLGLAGPLLSFDSFLHNRRTLSVS